MFKSFLISMFAILLFTLGAAASWFYVQMVADRPSDESMIIAPAMTNGSEADPIPKLDMLGNGGILPAVIRGPDLSAEEMFRLSTATKAKREQLQQYEERLREHKLRIKAADADTKSAQREVEGTLQQVRSLMDAIETLLAETKLSIGELQKERVETNRKADDLKKLETEAGAGVEADEKNFAEILQGMAPAEAAETIKEIANNGRMDFAIRLLKKMEERIASKILAEIGDPQLVAEIASRFTDLPKLR